MYKIKILIFIFFCFSTVLFSQRTYKEETVQGYTYYRVLAKDYSSWGINDTNGEVIIPLGKYEILNPIDDKGMILARKNGKEGFIDIHENVLIPFIYDDLGVFSGFPELAPAIKDGKQGFINRTNEVVIPFEYDAGSRVMYFKEKLAHLIKKGKHGVIDVSNGIVIPFQYDDIDISFLQSVIFVKQNGKWAFFSLTGKQLSDFKYDEIKQKDLNNSRDKTEEQNLPILTYIEKGNKYSFLDNKHHVIVKPGIYDYLAPFDLGRKAIVAKNGRYSIIDEQGRPLLPFIYNSIEIPGSYIRPAEIFIATTTKDEIVIFDKELKEIQPDDVIALDYSHYNSLFLTNKDNKTGIMNYMGNIIIPFEYDTIYRFRAPGYIARKSENYGLLSDNNEIIEPFIYKYIYEVKDNVVYVNKEGKAGIKDSREIIIPFEYEAIYSTYYNNFEYKETKYIVQKNNKIGTIDLNNNVVIPIEYDGLSGWVEYGPEGHFAKKDGKYGLISQEGNIIVPLKYDYLSIPFYDRVLVMNNGKYGILSLQHELILPLKYDKIIVDIPDNEKDYDKSRLVTNKNNVWSYYDLDGKLIKEDVPFSEIQKEYKFLLEWNWSTDMTRNYNMRNTSDSPFGLEK